MKTVLIAGGTGLIGARLSRMLVEKGYVVRHLSRRGNLQAEFPAYAWDPEKKTMDQAAWQGVQYVINLAGAGIADKPWTAARKQLIIDSRVNSTRFLKAEMQKLNPRPLAYVSGAAIGFYGNRGDEWLKEDSQPGSGFLSVSCQAWESAFQEMAPLGIRTVAFRIGIVLSARGGALPKLTMPLRFKMAPFMGSGNQWYSWVHIDDVCRMFIHALERDSMSGIYNAVAPEPVTNRRLTKALAQASGTRAFMFPVPGIALRIGLGEMADTVLSSARARADKVQLAGFTFQFPDLEDALTDILNRKV